MPEAANAKNAYTCRGCGFVVVTVNRDEGTTPFMIDCRAPGAGCSEMMQSNFYRLPEGAPEPTLEWYRPSLKKIRRLSSWEQEHVLKGGLLLRTVVI